MKNLLSDIPDALHDELLETLLEADSIRVERIVSHGHSSPEGFWYDQEQHEWVVVLKGAASLRFEGNDKTLEMKPGDFVNIPAHKQHRVEWTTPDETTVWLVVHYMAELKTELQPVKKRSVHRGRPKPMKRGEPNRRQVKPLTWTHA